MFSENERGSKLKAHQNAINQSYGKMGGNSVALSKSRTEVHTPERQMHTSGKKIKTGLAIVGSLHTDKVPSIPYEPKEVNSEE